MSIRKYSTRDYPGLLNVYSNSKLDELKYETAKFVLLPLEKDQRRLAQICESEIYVYGDQEVIAFCAYHGSEIRALFVHPKARGQGIGIKLLEFMLFNITDTASLYVAASNYPAIRLYKKHGFEIISEFKTTYNKAVVVANKMALSPATAN
ncbi:MAG: GNAT family N-acetyltransferase [Gammaproteobacteria bacterium]|nr:GNAT family N-acetyltransferase [Gammaproteobacteria bacterium]